MSISYFFLYSIAPKNDLTVAKNNLVQFQKNLSSDQMFFFNEAHRQLAYLLSKLGNDNLLCVQEYQKAISYDTKDYISMIE